MRIHKYRARWKDTGKIIKDFMDEYLIEALNSESFIVEEFTGLHDKNGKEIYEGDIVKHYKGIFEVKWNNDFAGFEFYSLQIRWDLNSLLTDTEVIGNIYENPKLLEVPNVR